MSKSLISKSTTTAAILLLSSACLTACHAHRELRQTAPDETAFTPTEAWLVQHTPRDTPMEMVLNDTSAGDRFLRTPSARAAPESQEVKYLIERMLETVKAQKGVGIAAPQVGINRRIILVQRMDIEPETPFRSYVNPLIESKSPESVLGWEGCLSIPAGFGQVSRAESIVISFEDREGKRSKETVSGFTARIFQHEIDHLDGVLFIDRKESEALISKEEYRKMKDSSRPKSKPPAPSPKNE